MSETTTTSTEPATGPIETTPPPAAVTAHGYRERRPSRLNVVAAWVGIVAGVVFVVTVIFGTGFVLGAHSGGPRGGDFGDRRGAGEMHREGPPMGPMFRPGPDFIFPGGPGGFPGGMGPGGMGPGGPGGQSGPGQAPTTAAPTPPTR